ncbi:hypothetical protein O0I10_012147 [Lichtheimia ornata]|uniref:Uncharacterized protein n=1 Tax=Lichtheimia ornata TaxID=688661 RepID=A0AAD7URK1_9FUNG|nr:uncharacterized protein O0I10_012147 [Lichtheimia ornata]KAJ8652239.1 hypothetical protein O0I10_012147 [Lichtheimia ornata]
MSQQQQQQSNCPPNVAEMIYRLKTRLALADFKRKHGYEKYDFLSLEWGLLHHSHMQQQHYHHPHPHIQQKLKSAFTLVTAAAAASSSPASARYYKNGAKANDRSNNTTRRYYYYGHSHGIPKMSHSSASIKKRAALSRTMTRSSPLLYPLSAKRSTSPSPTPTTTTSTTTTAVRRCASSSPLSKSYTVDDPVFSSDEEDAANLLVMLQRQQHA